MSKDVSPAPGPLPIEAVLGEIRAALAMHPRALLVAPPGAGKTTGVPPALLGEPWLAGKRILLLEPRRLAARAAAERMSATFGERLGETVGLRMRLATHVGPATRIEVVTEGVFTRLILDDPGLEGVGAVLFDEFHERSLDADLGLALALEAQEALRGDLRLMLMSATLDDKRLAEVLGGAPIVRAQGHAFPVATRYLGRDVRARIEDQMSAAILDALAGETGSILAFLPGQAEIRRTGERLAERIRRDAVEVVPLHGGLDIAEQRAATAPVGAGTRRVILATSIAETSITVDGVRVVIDCGLARVPRYEPGAGVTRLDTVRVPRSAADQRRGRAGRTAPGVCWRLWDEPETAALAAFPEPEIRNADLAGLVLDCAAWGTTDPGRLRWIDPPAPAQLDAAREVLDGIGALDAAGGLTPMGRRIRELPLPPRLAYMLVRAAERGAELAAARIAAVISERGLGGSDADLEARLEAFARDRGPRADRLRRLANDWARLARGGAERRSTKWAGDPISPAALLAEAFPDRIAKARGGAGQFLLANGRAAAIEPTHPLARAPYLVIADLTGAAHAMRILLAAPLANDAAEAIAARSSTSEDTVTFESATGTLKARRQRRLGAIALEATPIPLEPTLENAVRLADGAAAHGVARLAWSKAQTQLIDRCRFVRDAGDRELPDLSEATLSATAREWLAPFIVGKTRLAEIGSEVLVAALDARLTYAQRRRLEDAAPTHFEAPTGNRHPIDYEGAGAPILAIRVQELFGLTEHPAIAGGRLPLTLHLLSPAGRPIQITRDLPGFWKGSWADVKAEMKGRYPRHPWPDDPANAKPTARAKPRGT